VGEVVGVASEHDDVAGTQRGPNTIYCFSLDGVRFCHFGDFGQAGLRAEQKQAIGAVDVLFLPVGGGPTVGGESAAAIVRALRPQLVVPMHYRTDAVNFLDPPDAFLDALGARVERLDAAELDVAPFLTAADKPAVALLAVPTSS
jgi:L-ascorbate metabolism protein UlaG (beta-lactamase superfamily)